ncbi:MAG: hypothetical protein H7235_04870 [Bdellovibrionaceae bacterium]|nr:hypothetical protein [Pseudobdellovibrionaceae bacterium]
MNRLVWSFLISIVSTCAFANPISIADKLNSEVSCRCNGLPANLPVVGLFQTSHWGTSALKVFSVDDPQAQEKCQMLLKQLQEISVCN